MTTTELQLKIDEQKERFEKKRKELESSHGKVYALFSEELDDNGEKTGTVFAGFFKQPPFLAAALCMDAIRKELYTEAGLKLWPACFIKDASSPEIEQRQEIQLGMLPYLAIQVKLIAPELKKS